MTLDEVLEYAGEGGALKADGFDDCIIGVADRCSKQPLLVYDIEKILDKLVREGCTYEEAQEHFGFNIVGAWMGEGTPLFLTLVREEEEGVNLPGHTGRAPPEE
jgi:hypothetical protein